ncbi:MAG: N-acetyltransferase [Candidatus Kerfeldbacteria bacterium]|nr:N-acetyltransferase [Candidatus Kerfeldbacteria bacterium]
MNIVPIEDSRGFRYIPPVNVDDEAEIGQGTFLGPFTQVASGARIGRQCTLGQGCMVLRGAVIGDHVKIQFGVAVWNGVTLENGVFVAQGTTFVNDNTPRSLEPKGGKFVQTLVKEGATLGAGCRIGAVTIGRYAVVGMGAVVTRNVKDFSLVVGAPARHVAWVCKRNHGEQRFAHLVFETSGVGCCPTCGQGYQMKDGLVTEL